MGSVPPVLIFLVGALVVAVTKGHVRRAVLLSIPVIGALNLLGLQEGATLEFEIGQLVLHIEFAQLHEHVQTGGLEEWAPHAGRRRWHGRCGQIDESRLDVNPGEPNVALQ